MTVVIPRARGWCHPLDWMRSPLTGTRRHIQTTVCLAFGVAACVYASFEQGQDSDIPAEFVSDKVSDPVSKMLARIKAGTLKLTYEPGHGYLKSVLKELRISSTSQILVFSKTSLQASLISPNTPRAIYFNDSAYVAWIKGAPIIELIGIDPNSGPMFYSLSNRPKSKPVPLRQTFECFQCHYSPMSGRVPGLMARSVFAGPDGMPRFAGGSFTTTAKSPMKERWGGWYVTGRHGSQRHMGNEVARGDEQAPVINTEKGANVTDLRRYFDADSYPTPHSDIVALMIAEQQMAIQNLITKAGLLTRKALTDADNLRKLKFESDYIAETTRSRVRNACEPLVAALIGIDEPKLSAPLKGTSGFTSYFATTAPPDPLGRRLSALDLNSRLLRYPCSPMIYSKAFAGLPEEAKDEVFERLTETLSGKDSTKRFDSLSLQNRKAALEILRGTLPEFKLQSEP